MGGMVLKKREYTFDAAMKYAVRKNNLEELISSLPSSRI